MYLAVALRIPFQEPYLYSVPENFKTEISLGLRVLVPLRNKKDWGVVVEIFPEPVETGYKVLPIFAVIDDQPLYSSEMLQFTRWISDYYLCAQGEVLSAALPSGFTPQISKIEILPDKKFSVPFKIREKKTYFLHLLSSPPESSKNGKREQILRFLKERGGSCEKSILTGTFSGSSPVIKKLIADGIVEWEERKPEFIENESLCLEKKPEFQLNAEQEIAFREIQSTISNEIFKAFLLFGVTGSGKTEVYLRVAEYLRTLRKSVLILVPEIALTDQILLSFRRRLGNQVFVSHSGMTDRERMEEWKKIRKAEFCTVIGTRSAIFSPVNRLGAIIVDEEHDSSYKQEETPFYHSRDLAVKLAGMKKIPVVLGSATPSVESFHNAETGKYHLLTLKKRTEEAAMPQVQTIDMNIAPRSPRYSYISSELIEAVEQTVKQKLQVLLFLNRRGFDTRIECTDCGKTFLCQNCNLPYTWHKYDRTVVCHICKLSFPYFSKCPFCGSNNFKRSGIGIQKVEEHFKLLFPNLRILRFDSDTIRKKSDLENALEKIRNHDTDLILGTKMISKGHDFQKIGLVGVLGTDSMLNILHFRASERAYQMISQVSGRAGRAQKIPGKTFIQSYNPDHLILKTAETNDYLKFYKYEIEKRILCEDPPILKAVRLLISHREENKSVEAVMKIFRFLRDSLPEEVKIEGPVEWSVYRINRRFYWQILLKSEFRSSFKNPLREMLKKGVLQKLGGAARISVNIDP